MRVLSHIVDRDPQSITGRKLCNIKLEYGLDIWSESVGSFRLKVVRMPIPDIDDWSIDLLRKLLEERKDMDTCGDDTKDISKLIDYMYSS